MKIESIVFIIFMLVAIFSNQINKLNIKIFGSARFNWNIENEKVERIINITGRIIFFLVGLAGFIYFTFIKK